MPIPDHIKEIINKSEKRNVEYKKSFDEKDIKDTMLSFANSEGGKILVGIEESYCEEGHQKGKIVGLPKRNIDKDIKTIHNFSINFVPMICFKFNEYFLKDGRMIYVIEIEDSKEKPVCTRGGRYRIRGEKGNNAIFPDMMRAIIFDEKERLKMLLIELKQNKNEIPKHLSIIQNGKGGWPLSRFKISSLLMFMGIPSHFIKENYGHFEGLFHGFTILNNLLDLLDTPGKSYEGVSTQLIDHLNDVYKQIENMEKMISLRIEEISN